LFDRFKGIRRERHIARRTILFTIVSHGEINQFHEFAIPTNIICVFESFAVPFGSGNLSPGYVSMAGAIEDTAFSILYDVPVHPGRMARCGQSCCQKLR